MKRVFPTFMTLAAIVVLVFGFAELSEGQRDGRDRGRNRFEGPIDDFPLTALPRDFAAPPDNPQTPHKVELGRLLFWDPILSGNRAGCVRYLSSSGFRICRGSGPLHRRRRSRPGRRPPFRVSGPDSFRQAQ